MDEIKKYINILVRGLKGRYHTEVLDIDWRIILK
jgi:hypothetical protein